MTEKVDSSASPAAAGSTTSSVPDNISEGVGVVVRVRPLSIKERADPSVHNCIQALSDIVVIDANAHKRPTSVSGKPVLYAPATAAGATSIPASQPIRSSTRPYQFSVDHVFHTHASQIEVYEESCKRIVEGVFHGINGSILAYGATGSGKTHTMFGSTMSAAGIVYQAVQDIFAEKERLEEEEGKRVRIRCSFLEVYNEDVFDLLVKTDNNNNNSGSGAGSSSSAAATGPRQSKRVPLQVRETGGSSNNGNSDTRSSTGGNSSGSGGLYIPGLTHIFPETLEDFTRGIEHGHAQRFVASTGANAQSSRSHAIITVEVEVRDGPVLATATATTTTADNDTASDSQSLSNNTSSLVSDFTSTSNPDINNTGSASAPAVSTAGAKPARVSNDAKTSPKRRKTPTPTVTIASIQFVDLAGSERAASTSNTGLRLREGGNINRSLLALGAVVQSLAQQKVKKRQTGGKSGSSTFIPYRGSKLTRLLRDGIGGNCRTMMLFCVSPSTRQIEETVNTMKFAMNAREIQVVARRNEFAVNSSQLAKTQEAVIEELRAELARTRAALSRYTGGGGGDDNEGREAQPLASSEVKEVDGGTPTTAATAKQESSSVFGRQVSSATIESPTVANIRSNSHNNAAEDNGSRFSTAAAAGIPRSNTPSAAPQRGTMTPSTSAGGNGCPIWPTVSPLSVSQVEMSASSSMPRPSLSSRTARPSVFAENTRLFTELEAKLKEFSARKESLYHEVRDAEERERDGEAQLRDLQWRLATFLVSDAYGSRARGEMNILATSRSDGIHNSNDTNNNSTVGVAGLRKTIANMEEAQAQQSVQLTALTNKLEDADRQFAATRTALLRERQGTALELLLDNARLREGCTEAECLAAHYHQECRSLLNGESEYAEALSKCVGALQRLRPILTQLMDQRSDSSRSSPGKNAVDASNVAAALESVDVALLFALLPTSSTAQRMQMFESALRATTMAQPQPPPTTPRENEGQAWPSPSFTHPPLAPSPTNRSGSGGSGGRSPTRGGRPGGTLQSNQLAQQFRDLVATAESMNLTGVDNGHHCEGDEGNNPHNNVDTGPRIRYGHAQERAFGRTVSLTGLTATQAAPASAAGPNNSNNRKKTKKAVTMGPTEAAAVATTTKRPTQTSLQRSFSAPMPFSRSASVHTTPGTSSTANIAGGRGGSDGTSEKKLKAATAKPARSSNKTSSSNNNNRVFYSSPPRATRPNSAVTPEKTPNKKASKGFHVSSNPHLSPKAMWSVSGTNNKNAASPAAFARSNTVKHFSSPSKSRNTAGVGAGGAIGGPPLRRRQPQQRVLEKGASPPAKTKTTVRVSGEGTPHSMDSSSHRPSDKATPLNTAGMHTAATGAGAAVAANDSVRTRWNSGVAGRRNSGPVPQSQLGSDRRGSAAGAGARRGMARKLMRAQTSTPTPKIAANVVDPHAPSNLDQHYGLLDNTGITLSPLLSSCSSLGGDVDDAGRLRGLRKCGNESPAGDARLNSVKDKRAFTTTIIAANMASSMPSSLDSGSYPRYHHSHLHPQHPLSSSEDRQTKPTMARLLERSATTPALPHYSTRFTTCPEYEGGAAYLNMESRQHFPVPSRPRTSLPDDLAVSRSTLFSDSPLASRDLAGSGNYHQ